MLHIWWYRNGFESCTHIFYTTPERLARIFYDFVFMVFVSIGSRRSIVIRQLKMTEINGVVNYDLFLFLRFSFYAINLSFFLTERIIKAWGQTSAISKRMQLHICSIWSDRR